MKIWHGDKRGWSDGKCSNSNIVDLNEQGAKRVAAPGEGLKKDRKIGDG